MAQIISEYSMLISWKNYKEVIAASQLSVTHRILPKNENVFIYQELAKNMWNDIMSKAQRYYNIHFDLENNDYSKDRARVIRITRPSSDKIKRGDREPEDVFSVRCQLWNAGGDWELPVMYFRCQLQENSFYGLGSMKNYLGDMSRNSHWIVIPPFEAGNYNLVPGNIDGSFRAMHNDEKGKEYNSQDPDKNMSWNWLQKQFLQMVAGHCSGMNIPINIKEIMAKRVA